MGRVTDGGGSWPCTKKEAGERRGKKGHFPEGLHITLMEQVHALIPPGAQVVVMMVMGNAMVPTSSAHCKRQGGFMCAARGQRPAVTPPPVSCSPHIAALPADNVRSARHTYDTPTPLIWNDANTILTTNEATIKSLPF